MDQDESPSTEQSPLLSRPESLSTRSASSSKSRLTTNSAHLPHRNDGSTDISSLKGILIILCIGILIFLQATNFSILTTTQSNIAADLDAFEQATWLTSSYMVAMSSVSPLIGRLNQVFSPRYCIFVSSIILCTGSIITSLSSSLPVFLVGRIVAGAGAPGVFITASILALQLAPTTKRGLFLGLINSGMTTGISLGAILAGALEPKIGWKALFGIQTPLTFVAGTCLFFSIPKHFESHNSSNDRSLPLSQKLIRIDYPGALTLALSIVLFLIGLSGDKMLVTPLLLSFAILLAFIFIESYIAREPVVPISVLRSRGTFLTCLATVGFMMSRWGVLFYSPVYAIAVRIWNPAAAGSILVPTNAGFGIGGILAGWLHIRRTGSFYLPTLLSMLLFPITTYALALLSYESSPAVLYFIVLFVNGLATGASLNYALVHVLHLTPTAVHPIVLSLLATFRGFASSFGSAIGGGLFQRLLHGYLQQDFDHRGLTDKEGLIRRLLGSPALVKDLQGIEKQVAQNAYSKAISGLFFAGVGLSALMLLIQAGTSWSSPKEDETKHPGSDQVDGEEGLIGGP